MASETGASELTGTIRALRTPLCEGLESCRLERKRRVETDPERMVEMPDGFPDRGVGHRVIVVARAGASACSAALTTRRTVIGVVLQMSATPR